MRGSQLRLPGVCHPRRSGLQQHSPSAGLGYPAFPGQPGDYPLACRAATDHAHQRSTAGWHGCLARPHCTRTTGIPLQLFHLVASDAGLSGHPPPAQHGLVDRDSSHCVRHAPASRFRMLYLPWSILGYACRGATRLLRVHCSIAAVGDCSNPSATCPGRRRRHQTAGLLGQGKRHQPACACSNR